jgi:RNA-directed DNA polymerase
VPHVWICAGVPGDRHPYRNSLDQVQVVFRVDALSGEVDPEKRACNFVRGVASPVLANPALDGLEWELRKRFPKPKSGYNAQVNLVRYCDDWIIMARSQAVLEQEVKPLVENFLAERGLCLSPDKTKIIHIDEGFDFLGRHVRKYHDKLRIKPSPNSGKALLAKVREVIKGYKLTPAAQLLGQLSPPRGEYSDLCQDGACDRPGPGVLGQASASEQATRMDTPKGFSLYFQQPLGLPWHGHEPR